ncbi:MAG: DUF3857 and transglutaminase domain-containing protein [Bacteroidales bacterium]|nr:DUF3857 and transglutaminase domain-containing protein [Bacteroidales bacterium]
MLKKIHLISVLLILSLPLLADDIPQLIKKSGGPVEYPNDKLLVIFDSMYVDVQETGLSYVHTHQLFKVLTPKGALDLSVIKYGYDPLSAYVDILGVNIYREDGSIEKLDTSMVLDYPAPARMIYWGAREKMIKVGHLEPGDAVEVLLFKKGFTYALLQEDEDERYIPPMRGHFYDIIPFWSSNPVILKVYQIEISKDKSLQYEFYHGEVQSSMRFSDDKIIYTFLKRNIKPFKRESGMVATTDVAPKLLLSTSPDWEAKSLWFYGVNEDYGSFEFTPEIKAKVDEILEGAVNELDSISRLTHWTADEIRYSGISMGEGEGFTLHKGEMNFTDRCGVCKDKAGMLITMLRAAGFESYPAMTMAGSRIEDIPADQFNHSVTLVKLSNGKYKLLDPTWVPFIRELWSSAEQQQNYLMGIPEGADLAITPLSDPENHYLKIHGTSELKNDGTLIGNFMLTAEGQTDASIRGMFTRNRKSSWYSSLENELLKISPKAEILEVDYGDPYKYMEQPITIKIKYRIPDYALVSENEIIFTPLLAKHIFKRANTHLYQNTNIEEKKYPFRDRCSRLVIINETIRIPPYEKIAYIPEHQKSEGENASFDGGYEVLGKVIKFNETIALHKRIYDPEDWEAYRKAVKSQKMFAEEPIIVKLKN